MTQQTTSVVMSATDFDDSHYRTGQFLARIGKLWEPIAEEQQAIIDGQGYKHMNYDSWKEYWKKEWQEASGWSAGAVENWMRGRRNKVEAYKATGDVAGYEGVGATQWKDLSRIEPEQRIAFLDEYEKEIKPRMREEGLDGIRAFREGIKEFKGERVRDVLPPEEMAKLPSPDLSESENWVYQPGKTQMALRRLDPDAVADDAYRLLGPKVDNEVETINYIIDWYAGYRQAILSRKNTGLRAVQ